MEHIFILKLHILYIVIYQQYMFKYMVIIHIFIFRWKLGNIFLKWFRLIFYTYFEILCQFIKVPRCTRFSYSITITIYFKYFHVGQVFSIKKNIIRDINYFLDSLQFEKINFFLLGKSFCLLCGKRSSKSYNIEVGKLIFTK